MTTIKMYKSYAFKDKDPIIDQIRTIMNDEGASNSDASLASGVSTTTLYNWFDGATKRPQFATATAVLRSLGYDFKIVKRSKTAASARVIIHPRAVNQKAKPRATA